jgi:beta-glucosidase
MACAVLGLQAAAAANSATTPEPREEKGWVMRHEKFNERVKQGNVDLLMIGDSITHGWEGAGKELWAEHYDKRNAVNLGIGGDRTQHVLWRLQNGNIEGISPKAAVIMIGTNNFSSNTAPEIAEGVKAIVDYLRAELPEMKILLLAVFPRDVEPGTPNRQKLAELNPLLAKFADGEQVHFLDIGPQFLTSEGVLTREVMPDALHPEEHGYAIWQASMENKLAELMGETDGAKALYNGASLDGWKPMDAEKANWYAEPGLLYTDGEGGWLSTVAQYGDFELSLEFNVPPGGNSGVFVRAPLHGNPAFEGMEIQVLDDAAEMYKDLKPWQYCGSVYSVAAPKTKAVKPAGEWQQMKIRCEGPRVQVWLNGEHIIDENVENHEDKYAEHPGLKRREGHLGLQNHGARVEFRNIYIKELSAE